ncbi:hypothetical protein OTU49_002888 [Cherax quadricarinatus]|uniref:C-type lectin domain-containing protein n=1 Tax=Cherax quadricarinatus TaxID=27406 RepID=A0AAW0X7C1_CHEQU|nr:hypothetical protein CGJ15_25045 [Vibrio parahaemolyticus]
MKRDVLLLVATLIVGALVSLSMAQVSCPEPYILIGNTTCLYIPLDQNSTWDDARDYCITHSPPGYTADLAEFLECDVMSSLWNYIAYNLHKRTNYWIGGSDSAKEGTWKWVRSGTDVHMGVPFWFTGQPDGGTLENRLTVSENGYFGDGLETQHYNFICKLFDLPEN